MIRDPLARARGALVRDSERTGLIASGITVFGYMARYRGNTHAEESFASEEGRYGRQQLARDPSMSTNRNHGGG